MKVIEDVCQKYACACTVKTATKPPQPIKKSIAGASLLARPCVLQAWLPLKETKNLLHLPPEVRQTVKTLFAVR
jgi:hypothetical protein